MRNELMFNGRNLSEFRAYIASSNFMSSPSKDMQAFSIPGRNGDLQIDCHRFNNFILRARIYITENVAVNMAALRSFLNSCSGYFRYEESVCPDEFRLACFKADFDPDNYDVERGTVELTFDSKPQRFLKSGEIVQTFTASGVINNPTLFDSKPLIRIYSTGSNRTVGIGETTITVISNSTYTDIDCELMDCYKGTANRNAYVSFSSNDFPVISPGNNGITLGEGVTQVRVTPRWYRI